MRIATTLFVSCLLAACYGQLLPCAPNCRHEDDGALFPNPRDCTKFFQCADNIAVPHKCLTGLYFNPFLLACDYPYSGGCIQNSDDDCSDGGTTTTAASVQTTTVQSTVSATVAPDSTTVSGECRPDCPSAEATFPNPRDCSSFFKCAFSHPFLLDCPAGQWYDGPNERCDYIELVECNAGPDAPCVAVTNPTGPPQETTTVVSGSTTTDGGDDCVPPCPSDEALYPNPRDCGSFYQCAFGVPFLLKCPAGQEYAAALERCDWPEVAQCTAGPDSPCVAVTIPHRIVFRIR